MLINSNNKPVRIVGIGTMPNDLKDFLTEERIPVTVHRLEDVQNDPAADQYQYLVMTIKSLPLRAKILDWIDQSGLHVPIYIHDRAYVVDPGSLQPGSIIFPMASVLKCMLGRHTLITSNCHIAHCVEMADRCITLPGSLVCGSVRLSKNTLLQIGSTVKDNVTISAEGVNLLPRSLVTKNIDITGTYGGTPARRINSSSCLESDYWNQ